MAMRRRGASCVRAPLVSSQAPRRKDTFELFLEGKERWDLGNPTYKPAPAPEFEAKWQAQHKALGNL
jgi:hypothetical protein